MKYLLEVEFFNGEKYYGSYVSYEDTILAFNENWKGNANVFKIKVYLDQKLIEEKLIN